MFRGKYEEFLISHRRKSLLLALFCSVLLVQTATTSANEPALAVRSVSTNIRQGVSFTGVWDTVSEQGNNYTMTLKQDGSRVTGTYTPYNGKIEGQVSGRVLRFKWSQGDQRGSGRFILSKKGRFFTGTWSKSNDPDDPSGGTWNGIFLGKDAT